MNRRSILIASWSGLMLLVTAAPIQAQGTFRVHFGQPAYSIQPGGVVAVTVLIDPAPAGGLFSFGVSVSFDPTRAAAEASGITVPPDLDFNGVNGPGALKSAGDGFAATKGTVNTFNLPLVPYAGSLLATFLVTDHSGTAGGSYTLGLSEYRTLGSTETIFVDGTGQSLDDKIAFDETTVTILPEPGALGLWLLGLACAWWPIRKWRR